MAQHLLADVTGLIKEYGLEPSKSVNVPEETAHSPSASSGTPESDDLFWNQIETKGPKHSANSKALYSRQSGSHTKVSSSGSPLPQRSSGVSQGPLSDDGFSGICATLTSMPNGSTIPQTLVSCFQRSVDGYCWTEYL